MEQIETTASSQWAYLQLGLGLAPLGATFACHFAPFPPSAAATWLSGCSFATRVVSCCFSLSLTRRPSPSLGCRQTSPPIAWDECQTYTQTEEEARLINFNPPNRPQTHLQPRKWTHKFAFARTDTATEHCSIFWPE